jgi:hypothetical protein
MLSSVYGSIIRDSLMAIKALVLMLKTSQTLILIWKLCDKNILYKEAVRKHDEFETEGY